MTRWDIARMAALPHAESLPNEILLPRTHYTGYAHALRASGARLVDIGHNDRGTGAGVRGLEAWEIEVAITPRTAAFAFSANPATCATCTVVAYAKPRDIPVIVDAAAQLPPKSNLKKFLRDGRRPGRVLRRQGDRRPAGLGHPRGTARSGRRGAGAAARHGCVSRYLGAART